MAVVLALVSALSFGLSDFIGGLVSRRASAWPVAVVVQVSSAVSTALIALFVSGSPAPADFGWALLAGTASGVGVGFLFRGLATGRMSVVAPLSAVGSALVPVALGFALGERPGVLVSLAIVAAFPGIWLVASGESGEADAPGVDKGAGLLDGVLAGLGFGIMFAALGQVPDGAGLWPLTVTQAMSVVSVATLAVLLKAPWRPDRAALSAAPAGPLSAVAVLTFQLATQAGLLTVSSVLASLYPAATVLLAMGVLRERVHATQALGLVLCGVTVTLVALG